MHLSEKDTRTQQDLDLNKWEIQMGKSSRLMAMTVQANTTNVIWIFVLETS